METINSQEEVMVVIQVLLNQVIQMLLNQAMVLVIQIIHKLNQNIEAVIQIMVALVVVSLILLLHNQVMVAIHLEIKIMEDILKFQLIIQVMFF
jgi:hypothetical protein